MKETPILVDVVESKIKEMNIIDFSKASIREIVEVTNNIEAETGDKYVRMEMGIPGLPAAKVGVDAEIQALKNGVASMYPNINGIPEVKQEAARFIKSFMNVDVSPKGCIPTTGSMQGTYAVFKTVSSCTPEKDTTLFIDPGFPVQKQQFLVMGERFESFDLYHYRGKKLEKKLENLLSQGHINSIVYSNPNNPTWVCLTEDELKIIGEMANKYDVLILEDLAYFGMDYRRDISMPNEAPFQPTVARYTNNWVMFLSASKIFSYAGQRIAMMIISDDLYNREYPGLVDRMHVHGFGNAIVQRVLYAMSSGTSHSAQYAMAAMLKSASDGVYNFLGETKAYADKAHVMKEIFTSNGFEIVYDKDLSEDIADGFYFTIGYPGMDSGTLLHELMFYGVSAITLDNTGSERQGLRACVSHVKVEQFPVLKERLVKFKADHPIE